MVVNVKVSLTDEEQKRWNDAYAILGEIYDIFPYYCEAREIIEKAIYCFEDFAKNYIEN